MSRKRRVVAAPPPPVSDAKLQRVTCALENVTRTGATFVSGASDRFPPPALAFTTAHQLDEDDDELRPPLHPRDAHKIKARGTVSQQSKQRVTAWEVDGARLESRNPTWRVFLDEWLTSQRGALGISPTAVVDVTLRKMVLAEAGARLDAHGDGDARGSAGVFGTLLVVLPGAFKGAELWLGQPLPLGPPQSRTATWKPEARGNAYGISYAAFYNSCGYASKPVRDGAALCLVYDLVTTTPSDVPLFGGSSRVQQSVASALYEFFDASPAPMAKRFRIGQEARRAIHEFMVQRQFVYAVTEDTFEGLDGESQKVANSLAAFCEQSGGQYVLYHANLVCSSSTLSFSMYDDEDVTAGAVIRVALTAPWIKHGASGDCAHPPIILGGRHQVAPTGRLDNIQGWYHVEDTTGASKKIVTELHRGEDNPQVHKTYALVVLPTSIERSQIAKLPIHDMTQTLTRLFAKSREEALQLARRIVDGHSDWQLGSNDMKAFNTLVKIFIQINDCQLFTDLLLAIHLKSPFPTTALGSAVKHFGWDACANTLVKKILSTSTLRGRVNLVIAVFYNGWGPAQVNALLDALLSLHPWTNVTIGQHARSDSHVELPDIKEFANLLVLTDTMASERIRDVVAVLHMEEMVSLVVPALTQLLAEYVGVDVPGLRAALHHVWGLYQPMLDEVRNESFARMRIPRHCPKCDELKLFLSSPVTERTLEVSDESEFEHMRAVLQRATTELTVIKFKRERSQVVRLKKFPVDDPNSLSHRAQEQAAKIERMLR